MDTAPAQPQKSSSNSRKSNKYLYISAIPVVSLLIFLYILIWAPWATESFARDKVWSSLKTECKELKQGPVPIGRLERTTLPETIGVYPVFGDNITYYLICDDHSLTNTYYVSFYGSIEIISSRSFPLSESLDKGKTGTQPPEKNETSAWKTYRNQKHKFEIKYPATFSFDKPSFSPSGAGEFKFKSENYEEVVAGEYFVPKKGGTFYIDSNNFTFSKTKNELSERVDFEKTMGDGKYNKASEEELMIDKRNAYKFTYEYPDQVGIPPISQEETLGRIYTVGPTGMPYIIELRYFSVEADTIKTLKEILSTFKFLDQ